MNILDIIVWLALAVAVFNGWRKGFIGKLFSLAGLVGGIWLALGYGARCGEALHMEGTTAAVAGRSSSSSPRPSRPTSSAGS